MHEIKEIWTMKLEENNFQGSWDSAMGIWGSIWMLGLNVGQEVDWKGIEARNEKWDCNSVLEMKGHELGLS